MRSIKGAISRTAFAVFAASGLIPFAAQAATRCPSWSGTAGGLTGQFASTSLPSGFRLSFAGNKVSLVKTGACIIFR